MRKLLITLPLFLLSLGAVAEEQTDWGQVVEIWSGYKNGKILFKLDAAYKNPKSCGGSGFYSVNPEVVDRESLLPVLLMAKASQQSVKLVISSTECFEQFPSVLRVGIN